MSKKDIQWLPELLSLDEVSQVMGLGASTVRRLAKLQKMPQSVKIGGSTKWLKRDLMGWIEAGAPPFDEWKRTGDCTDSTTGDGVDEAGE